KLVPFAGGDTGVPKELLEVAGIGPPGLLRGGADEPGFHGGGHGRSQVLREPPTSESRNQLTCGFYHHESHACMICHVHLRIVRVTRFIRTINGTGKLAREHLPRMLHGEGELVKDEIRRRGKGQVDYRVSAASRRLEGRLADLARGFSVSR